MAHAASPKLVHMSDARTDPVTGALHSDLIYIAPKATHIAKSGRWVRAESRWQVPEQVAKDPKGDLLKRYKAYLKGNRTLLEQLFAQLRGGKSLVCWCRGKESCHGSIILELFAEHQRKETARTRFMAFYAKAAAKRAISVDGAGVGGDEKPAKQGDGSEIGGVSQ